MAILITGGTKGIGRGIAERFAGPDVTVLLNYANDDVAAQAAADAVTALGGTPVLLKRDVSTTPFAFSINLRRCRTMQEIRSGGSRSIRLKPST